MLSENSFFSFINRFYVSHYNDTCYNIFIVIYHIFQKMIKKKYD